MDALVRLDIIFLSGLWHSEIEAGSHHAIAVRVLQCPVLAKCRQLGRHVKVLCASSARLPRIVHMIVFVETQVARVESLASALFADTESLFVFESPSC